MRTARIHTGYAAWFAGWTFLMVVGDLLSWPVEVRGAFLVGFLITEAVALIRPEVGDTFSEVVWSMLRDRPALIPPTIGWVLFFGWQWVEIAPALRTVETWLIPEAGLVALLVGTIPGWLIPHLILLGRHG